jgi:nitrite reductase/ring-hydroxylating ferredoxin subunit
MPNPFIRFSFVVLIILIVTGCSKKEDNQNEIPYVYVNIPPINPNSTEFIRLNPVNGWEYITGGYRGIIVFRKSVDEFAAYERACPHDWQIDGARIDVDTSGITALCPVCKSKFILLDGSLYEGPSHYPLKQYQTRYDQGLLYIFN